MFLLHLWIESKVLSMAQHALHIIASGGIQPHSSLLPKYRPQVLSFRMPTVPVSFSQAHAGRCLLSCLSGRSLSFNTGFTSFVKATFLPSYKVIPVATTPTTFTALIRFIYLYCFIQTTSSWKTGTVSYLCFHPSEYSSA